VTALRLASPGPVMRRLAAWMGVTEGHAYTLVIGLVIALATAAIGIPPTLSHRRIVTSASAAALPTVTSGKSLTVAGSSEAPADGLPSGPLAARATPAALTADAPATAPPSDAASSTAPPLVTAPAFADGGALGEVHPLARVGQPGAPEGIAVDQATGAFYVGTDNGTAHGTPGPSQVLAYSADGALTRVYAVTGQRAGQANGLTGLALDGTGGLDALDASAARVVRIDLATGAQTDIARMPDVPVCPPTDQAGACELSPTDTAPLPKALAFGPSGDLYVADTAQGIVWKVTPTGAVSLWDKSVDFVAPTGAGPAGLAFDGAGRLVLVVSETLVALTGAVYEIPIDSKGTAGNHTRLWQSNPQDSPTGVAIGRSGKVYVASTGTNALVVLNPDGSVLRTVTSAAFDTPTGIAFRGQSLLVTNPSAKTNTPANWTVVRAPVQETGVVVHEAAG